MNLIEFQDMLAKKNKLTVVDQKPYFAGIYAQGGNTLGPQSSDPQNPYAGGFDDNTPNSGMPYNLIGQSYAQQFMAQGGLS